MVLLRFRSLLVIVAGNLVGAFAFAGQCLRHNLPRDDRWPAKILLSTAGRIGKNKNLTPERRYEVAKAVVGHDVDARLEKLDPHLEPETGKK